MSDKEEVKTEENTDNHEKVYDLTKISEQVAMFRDKLPEQAILDKISAHIKQLLKSFKLEEYHVVFLFDQYNSISELHSDKIYRAVTSDSLSKDILMILESNGGRIEPAYLISKTCKRLTNKNFKVSIPRKAKSAATLISLGADEIHMGLLSELGPIDPQFGGFPALGLSNAVEKIAQMTSTFPSASDMFAKYLTENVNIRDLGYFERINESATQYAIRLLNGKELPNERSCEDLADHFTNHYKDHSFVIDSDEATELLGENIVKNATNEYQAGNAIYEFLHFLNILFGVFFDKRIRYVGSVQDGLESIERDQKE